MSIANVKEIFFEQGYIGPIKFLDSDELHQFKLQRDRHLEEIDWMNTEFRRKANFLFPFINKLSKNPILLAYVKEIIGPNFSCYDSYVWNKDPKNAKHVPYHRDGIYWNFQDQTRALTVWITLSGATKEMGCLKYIRDSHRYKTVNGKIVFENQQLDKIDYIESNPGEFVMHHPYMLHGSDDNKSNFYRDGYSFCFVATDTDLAYKNSVESSIMVSGVDNYNYLIHEDSPSGDWHKDLETWNKTVEQQSNNFEELLKNSGFELPGLNLKEKQEEI